MKTSVTNAIATRTPLLGRDHAVCRCSSKLWAMEGKRGHGLGEVKNQLLSGSLGEITELFILN